MSPDRKPLLDVDGLHFESDIRCDRFVPDRSPGQYTTFTDLYGHKITVRYSSLATSAAVWIFAGLMPEQRAALERVGLNPALFGGAAHLCRAMAREVRDRLDDFLAEPVEETLACETRTPRTVVIGPAQ